MKESIKAYYDQLLAFQRSAFDKIFMKNGKVVDYNTLEGREHELAIRFCKAQLGETL